MSTTTHRAGPRFDTDMEIDKHEGWRFWYRTHYPAIDLYIVTAWWDRWYSMPETATTCITERLIGLPGALYRKEYDPARVTVGGLAEAHEAVCARVERGELP